MSSSIDFKGDLTLSMRVRDMDASIRWYTEKLGFELMYRIDEMNWCEMRSPIQNVTVGLGQSAEMTPNDSCVPVWGVKDIAAARKTLESKGVRFNGESVEVPNMVKLATFFDPDNNSWMLVQSLQQMA